MNRRYQNIRRAIIMCDYDEVRAAREWCYQNRYRITEDNPYKPYNRRRKLRHRIVAEKPE